MRDYHDGGPAMGSYLARMSTAPATLSRLKHLHILDRYLNKLSEENTRLGIDERRALQSASARVLSRPEWESLADKAIHSDDLSEVSRALNLADRFGIDPKPVIRQWLPTAPHDGYLWQELLIRADRDEMGDLVSLAEELLPFAALPTGPGNDLGVGPDYRAAHCLDLLLQELRHFPGLGESAIRLGLQSPVVRARNMALRAFQDWPLASRPQDMSDQTTQMAWSDPDPGVRKRARRVASGLPADETRH
jgi:hypothetical protein